MTKKLRHIRIDGDVAYIPLTRGYEAVIDTADLPLVEGRNWSADVHKFRDGSVRFVYAVARIDYRKVAMHRVLFGHPENEIDHKDRDGLNNRRSSNLRLATHQQNIFNTGPQRNNRAGIKGVFYSESEGKWIAQIKAGAVRKKLGRFSTAEGAQAAYAAANAALHGAFGRTA